MANGTLAISQLEMLSLSGTGVITITPPATNTNRAITLPDAAGALVVSGTTPSLNGITFPATQSASADANTLDDYEEGAWTPSLGGNTTYIVQTGSYTKVGRLVFIRGILIINVLGTGSTTQISGLPFANASGNICTISIGSFYASATAVVSFLAGITNGGSVINVNSLTAAGTTQASNAIFANSAQLEFTGCYNV
jgi:hypothetical protein